MWDIFAGSQNLYGFKLWCQTNFTDDLHIQDCFYETYHFWIAFNYKFRFRILGSTNQARIALNPFWALLIQEFAICNKARKADYQKVAIHARLQHIHVYWYNTTFRYDYSNTKSALSLHKNLPFPRISYRTSPMAPLSICVCGSPQSSTYGWLLTSYLLKNHIRFM